MTTVSVRGVGFAPKRSKKKKPTLINKYQKWPSLRIYERLSIPYMLFGDPWHGPIWTGQQMMLSADDDYGDQGFLHELFHWVAASPAQRRHPDFALGAHVNAGYSIGGSDVPYVYSTDTMRATWTLRDDSTRNRNRSWGGEPVITHRSAQRQEDASSDAMFFYEAVTTGNWQTPTISPDAAWDFHPWRFEYPPGARRRVARGAKTVLDQIPGCEQTVDHLESYFRQVCDLDA